VPTEARAAVLRAFRCPLEIRQVLLRDPADGEVLVRISAAGICTPTWARPTESGTFRYRLSSATKALAWSRRSGPGYAARRPEIL
jgi:hypothetical protein